MATYPMLDNKVILRSVAQLKTQFARMRIKIAEETDIHQLDVAIDFWISTASNKNVIRAHIKKVITRNPKMNADRLGAYINTCRKLYACGVRACENPDTFLSGRPMAVIEAPIRTITIKPVKPSVAIAPVKKDPKAEYQEYLKSEHWQTTRRLVLERDHRHCMICRSTKAVQVHHNTYDRRGHEAMDDLITLCDGCHEIFHGSSKLCR